MAKNTSRQFAIKETVFDYVFNVFYGKSKGFEKLVKDADPDMYQTLIESDSYTCITLANEMGCYIHLSEKSIDSIVHEAHHAITHMFSFRSDIKNDSESMEEVMAYYNGWLANEITSKLMGRKK